MIQQKMTTSILLSFFLVPICFCVIGGLLVATWLTLLFLPALYVLWFRVKEPLTQEMPQAELVPA